MFVFLATLMIASSFGGEIKHELDTSEMQDVSLQSECQAIEELHERKQCEFVFENDYIKWSEKMLADDKFVSELEVVHTTVFDVRNSKISRRKRSVKDERNTCPILDVSNPAYTPIRLRSTSPWEMYITQDANRKPMRMIQARCLCSGCIDVRTNTEDRTNVFSEALVLSVPVLKNGKMMTEEVAIGCTCVASSSLPIGNLEEK
uniref:interleukin-17C-like n=1 Tax=Styela clava TaxID=7725 RepID=UPI00193A82A6|nr:interleukin-17C-like [Styela clava]